jgi:four helix bundle protein
MARSYRQLLVWQKAKALAGTIYRITSLFPSSEIYGLTSQMRRAGVSIASNIAEGQGRLTTGEFRHFLGQARGSLLELETQLAIARDLKLVDLATYEFVDQDCYAVLGLINRLSESLRLKGETNQDRPPRDRLETLKP